MNGMPDQRPPSPDDERLRRWRLILGANEADGTDCRLSGN
jgi:hypothetical protein